MQHKELAGPCCLREAAQQEAEVVGWWGWGQLLLLRVGNALVEALLEERQEGLDVVGGGPGVRDAGVPPLPEAGQSLLWCNGV